MTEVASLPGPRPQSRTSLRSPSPQIRPSSIPLPPTPSTSEPRDRSSAPPSSFPETPVRPPRSKRRSSYDTLVQLSAGESLIPLPLGARPDPIQEGVPLDTTPSKPIPELGFNLDGRPLTPTRSLSRIPVSSVGNARALAENDGRSISPLPPLTPHSAPLPSESDDLLSSMGSKRDSMMGPPSSYRDSMLGGSNRDSMMSINGYKRMSLGGGGTTKVLGDLQTAASNARNALDNTRQQLRLSQRSVGSLTRQVEDLKEGRERLRLENESLNNVVTRKERLLQELLDRARKAESESTQLKTQLKAEQAAAKKASTSVTEALEKSAKAVREAAVLKESWEGLNGRWDEDVRGLREEMKSREEAWKEEAREMGVKYAALVKLVKATSAERSRIEQTKAESAQIDDRFNAAMREELDSLKKEVVKATTDAQLATTQAEGLAVELARLRRLMRAAGSQSRGSNVLITAAGPET